MVHGELEEHTSRTEFENSLHGRNKELCYVLLLAIICRTTDTSKKINVLAFILRSAILHVGLSGSETTQP